MIRPSRSFAPREPKHRRNGKIRAREVRVLDDNKQQLGIMTLKDALTLAQTKGLDLIETVPDAEPPVCIIAEYGKLLYREAKKKKESQTKGSSQKIKELQLTPNIGDQDFATKLSHAIEFLSEDAKVQIRLRFRGRQRAHKEYGFAVVNRFVKAMADYGKSDMPPRMLGDRDISIIVSPLPREKRGKGQVSPQAPTASTAPTPTIPESQNR